ncbi:hypothetical protein QW180_03775 [Vibrio sinaloensis]|nr:hypothetical protein [Vibrio sinaloensis]
MIAEIGHFALIVSLAMAVLLSILPLVGASRNNTMLMNTARPLSWGDVPASSRLVLCIAVGFLYQRFHVELCSDKLK